MLQSPQSVQAKLINKDKKVKNFTQKALWKTTEAGVFLTAVMPGAALAQSSGTVACDPNNLTIEQGANCAKGNSNSTSLFGEGGTFQQIANVLIFLIGAVAVIMLILGGLQYVISNGDPKRVEQAKNTILYSIIGIVVAILAFAIVSFVTGSLAPTSNN